MRKTGKLNAKQHRVHLDLCTEFGVLKGDGKQRFNNAILALSKLDPKWMVWLEGVDQDCSIEEITRTIEARARALVLVHYPTLKSRMVELIFSDYPFSNTGSLVMG